MLQLIPVFATKVINYFKVKSTTYVFLSPLSQKYNIIVT